MTCHLVVSFTSTISFYVFLFMILAVALDTAEQDDHKKVLTHVNPNFMWHLPGECKN